MTGNKFVVVFCDGSGPNEGPLRDGRLSILGPFSSKGADNALHRLCGNLNKKHESVKFEHNVESGYVGTDCGLQHEVWAKKYGTHTNAV
jgi:hypothetical protein